jgi:hypothetical protein
MKNSASTFRVLDAPECTTLLTDQTRCENKSSESRVLKHFLSNSYRPDLSLKNSASMIRNPDAPKGTT